LNLGHSECMGALLPQEGQNLGVHQLQDCVRV
jgi:hypothetical protein